MSTVAAETNPADALIDEFVARSRLLNGREIVERAPWNTCATADAIRHFAYGTSDGNPLWLDTEYAQGSSHTGLLAPPTFLCSVLYPFLHGAPMDVPLSSLIGKVAMEWFHPIREGDRLRASARQIGVTESLDRRGRRLILIDAETRHWNQRDELVGIALGTMARIARGDGDLLLDREIYRYTEAERASIRAAFAAETRRGADARTGDEVWVGQPMPVFVRGPLSIGDLVCWQAAIGPSYRAGALGYRDMLQTPYNIAVNPVTGWPVKYSQQHEDFLMAAQRGMPAPFDNSLMRFAWLAPMVTDWMGDAGFLKRLSVQTDAPVLYGDTVWYRGIVTQKRPAVGREGVAVTIRISGINQLGQTTTSGEAEVILPTRCSRTRSSAQAARICPEAAQYASVLDLFQAQVVARHEEVAVQCKDAELTFAALDAQADKLAQKLQEIGVGPRVPVALMLERNLDAVIAIMATLKAGCAYLPLDYALPVEKLKQILSTLGPGFLIAPEARLSSLSEMLPLSGALGDRRCKLFALEALRRDVRVRQSVAPATLPVPEDLAYIMPTSGTTGGPRLVAVSHRSLGRYLQSLRESLGITPQDVCLHTAAFTFSASVRQLFLPLCVGARLVIAEDAQRFDPLALWKLMKRRTVTVWDTVPSVWQNCIDNLALLAESDRAELLDDSLRLILTTGEALQWDIPRRWRREMGHSARVQNLYSQTETAGTVCVYHLPDEIPDKDGYVPLGRPLDAVTVDLLDADFKPVAAGQIGEICISGSRLASGYFGQSSLTAERFALRPFHYEGFFRTGDLARRLADGSLEFVGRGDDRIKIRGQRVELGEVEEALRGVVGVDDAVVVIRENGQGRARLVAYLVGAAGTTGGSGEILSHLRKLLPDAALPEVFVPLERLPRNAAGKVDRTALPLPGHDEAAQFADKPVAHRTLANSVERIFAEALELRRVGHDEDFFDLGGNSLMATVVITRLRTTFKAQIPMVRFFEKPTVAAVAAVIEESLLLEVEAMTEEEVLRRLDEDATS